MKIIGHHLHNGVRGQAVRIFQVLIGTRGVWLHHYSLGGYTALNKISGHRTCLAATRDNNLLAMIKGQRFIQTRTQHSAGIAVGYAGTQHEERVRHGYQHRLATP